MKPPELVIPDTTFTCTMCGKELKATEFYWSWNVRDSRWQRDSRCKDCHNGTKRTSPAKVINRRARQRATALLLQEYAERFEELLAQERRVAAAEYAVLEQHKPGDRQVLRAGRRRPGETVLERLDIARCTECHTHHDRGHVCPKCGAATTEEIPTEEDVEEVVLDASVVEDEPEEEIDWEMVSELCRRGYIAHAGRGEVREAAQRMQRNGMALASIAKWLHLDYGYVESLLEQAS